MIALPPMSTTTVGLPVAATASISSSCLPGRPSSARSRNSPFLDAGDDDGDVARRAQAATAASIVASRRRRRRRHPRPASRARCRSSRSTRAESRACDPGASVTSRRARAERSLLPVVDHEPIVEIQPIAVVAFDADLRRRRQPARRSCRSSAPNTSRTECRGPGELSVQRKSIRASVRVSRGAPSRRGLSKYSPVRPAHGLAADSRGELRGRHDVELADRCGRDRARSEPRRARAARRRCRRGSRPC